MSDVLRESLSSRDAQIYRMKADIAARNTELAARDAEIARLKLKLRDAEGMIEWHAQNEATR